MLAAFRTLAESLPEAMLLVDTSRIVRACNPAAERLFGRARSALVHEPLATLFDDPSERVVRWFGLCAASTGLIPARLLIRAGGSRVVLAEGGALENLDAERHVVVRVRHEGTLLHRFAELNRRVDSLHEEVARRTHTEHALLVTQLKLREANAELARLAEHDALTGLSNRRGFDRALASALADAHLRDTGLALVLFDIDHFKRLNDASGHLSGDRCLVRVAEILQQVFRRDDEVARFGGEEFAAILSGLTLAEAKSTAFRTLEAMRNARLPHPDSPSGLIVTMSAGVACMESAARIDAPALVQIADEALYEAKAKGRDRICVRVV
jgi:diguanylate cyclase (GGDEF)-like protein/PAS domain S-box-containing protein